MLVAIPEFKDGLGHTCIVVICYAFAHAQGHIALMITDLLSHTQIKHD